MSERPCFVSSETDIPQINKCRFRLPEEVSDRLVPWPDSYYTCDHPDINRVETGVCPIPEINKLINP